MAVVREAEVAPSASRPVAEERRERAVAGSELRRRRVAGSARVRPNEEVAGAVEGRRAGGVQREIPADREGREPAPLSLPGGGERGRVLVGPGVEAPPLVGSLEGAAAEPAKEDRLADPEDGEVGLPVTVDVERRMLRVPALDLEVEFPMADFTQYCLVNGLDDIDLMLGEIEAAANTRAAGWGASSVEITSTASVCLDRCGNVHDEERAALESDLAMRLDHHVADAARCTSAQGLVHQWPFQVVGTDDNITADGQQ